MSAVMPFRLRGRCVGDEISAFNDVFWAALLEFEFVARRHVTGHVLLYNTSLSLNTYHID